MLPEQHGERFPKFRRLRKSFDFRRVQGRGRRVQTKNLLVLYRPGAGPNSRFGLTVSRKVGNAVTRNRVKRWLRESVRRNQELLDGCYDVVLIARRSAANAGYQRLSSDFRSAIERVGKAG